MDHFLHKARVLVTVKTYPIPSKSYDELVCTAGLLDGKEWVRIYPVPYRQLSEEQQYSKWDWVELNLERRTKDHRPESYRPIKGIDEEFRIIGRLDQSGKHFWSQRREILLKNVYSNLEEMILEAKSGKISLGVLKPKRIMGVESEKDSTNWDEKDRNLFLDLIPEITRKRKFKPVQPLPFKFFYVFESEDGKSRRMMVEDWEIGALYWNCFSKDGNQDQARAKVILKMEELAEKDLYFVLGTTMANHHRAPNPFVIVGLFYPPYDPQGQLDFSSSR